MRLNVGSFRPEQLLGPLDGNAFDHIHMLAATVISPPRISFGVLVGQHAAHGLHDRRRGVILTGDQFQSILLAPILGFHRGPHIGILRSDNVHEFSYFNLKIVNLAANNILVLCHSLILGLAAGR